MGAAFTLVETLGVLAVLALTVSLVGMNFGVQIDAARLESLSGELRSLDARARLLARTQGSLWMRRDAEAVEVVRVVDGASVDRRVLPVGVTLRWEAVDGDSLDAVGFGIDRFGRSSDVVWHLATDSRERELRWSVLGWCGQARFAP